MSDEGFIESAGHPYWVPLPLDLAPEAAVSALRARYAGSAPEEQLEAAVSAVHGIIARLQSPGTDPSVVCCAAWVLTRSPDRLDIDGTALLRASVVDPALTPDSIVTGLIGEGRRHGEPLVEPIETCSGEALSVRFRPIADADGRDEVHQVNAVLWIRPQDSVAFILSTYVERLVDADGIGDRLEELGAGLRGI